MWRGPPCRLPLSRGPALFSVEKTGSFARLRQAEQATSRLTGRRHPLSRRKWKQLPIFACRRCTIACLLWPAGTTNQPPLRLLAPHSIGDWFPRLSPTRSPTHLIFTGQMYPVRGGFRFHSLIFLRADFLQRPRQTRTKCCYQGCGTPKPPHLRNGAPLLNSGASFWGPPCSRQREMSPYGTYAHRNGLGQEFGVSSWPSPGYFTAALGVVGCLTSLY